MKKFFTRARRLAALCTVLAAVQGAAQSAVLAPAHADILTFDSVAPVALLGGESFRDGGYVFTALEGPVTAGLGLQSGTGAVLDPGDPGTCDTAACPSGAGSRFYAGLNDGGMQLSRADGHSFSVTGFDFAFLAPMAPTGDLLGQLLLTGVRSSGASLALALDFAGRDAYGDFMFSSASLGALNGVQFSSVAFSACVFSDGACVNSFDLPAYNEAQFALDNIGVNVSAVPEPSAAWLLAAGLGMLAWLRRRHAAVARRAPMLRGALAATLLLLGGVQGAQAHLLTFTGDTTGAPTYQRVDESGMYPEPWSGDVAYRVYDVFLAEDTRMINFLTTCDFDCGMFVYQSVFNPANPSQNFLGGDDNFVGFKTAGLGGGLYAGHYAMVITGNAAPDFGFFSTTISSTGAFVVTDVTPVPEPSTWLMLAAGLALLLRAAHARMPRLPRQPQLPPHSQRSTRFARLRLALAASFLLAGVSQPALADVVTVTGDTTWGPTFHRPGRNGSAPSEMFGLDVAYSAFNVSVSFTDWQHQSIITACDFDCAIFLYRGAFDPLQPMHNIMDGSAENNGRPALEMWLDVGQNYVLVVAGYYDFDWGAFSTTIGSGGGIDVSPVTGAHALDGVSAVPEPSAWLLMLGGMGMMAHAARRRHAGRSRSKA